MKFDVALLLLFGCDFFGPYRISVKAQFCICITTMLVQLSQKGVRLVLATNRFSHRHLALRSLFIFRNDTPAQNLFSCCLNRFNMTSP